MYDLEKVAIGESSMKKKAVYYKSGLRGSLLRGMLIPVILFGILIIVYSSRQMLTSIHEEVESGLKNVAQSALYMYEKEYPGKYHLDEATSEVCKGGKKVQGASEILDRLKTISGADVTIFYNDIRIITTIRDEKGKPFIGTKASSVVKKEVLGGKTEQFYTRTTISDVPYFAYYCPIYDDDGACIGMVFSGKPSEYVQGIVLKGLMPIITIILLAICVIVCIAWIYADRLVKSLQTLQNFLVKVEEGNLAATLGETIVSRKDEIGKIGKSALQMQSALRQLVERDSLTGLYNRYYGEVCLKKMIAEADKEGTRFYVAIADIDFFKKFNDHYGHDCGDKVLKEISHILEQSMRRIGYAARWGGEEFLLIFRSKDMEHAKERMMQLSETIREYRVSYDEENLKVTVTIGFIEGKVAMPVDDMIKMADRALYEGKETGRDKVVCGAGEN